MAVVGQAHRSQRHAVRGVGHQTYGVAYLVHLPVAALAALQQRVQRPGGRPHDVGPRLVVLRVLGGYAAAVDERPHQAFVDIVGGAVRRTGEVLLHQVAHDIEEARHHLVLRHREGEAGVEDGELGHHVAAKDTSALEACSAVGDDAAAVHLAARAHHRKHRAHRHYPAVGALAAYPVFLPWVLVAPGADADGLGIVYRAAAAYGQYQVDIVVVHQTRALAHLLDGGVGHHTGVLHHPLAGLFEGRHHGVVDAVALDGAAAIAQHHRGAIVLQLADQMAHSLLAEIELRGVVE